MLLLVFLNLILPCSLVFAVNTTTPFQVVIDAGHGGVDSGAVQNGIREADLSLSIAQKIAETLQKDPRFRVTLTRTHDQKLDLKKRAMIANHHKGDLFLSIHANSSTDAKSHGAEFYFQNQLPASEEELFLAARENEVDQSPELNREISSFTHASTRNADVLAIIDDLHRNHRIKRSDQFAAILHGSWKGVGHGNKSSIRQAPFYLVSNVNMPSLLIELGYLTNAHEAQALNDPEKQQKIASNLYQAIVQFKELLDNER